MFDNALIVIPIVIVSMFIVVFGIIRAIMSCWKTVPPNVVAVVSGRKYAGKGYKIVKGGGFFRIPILERVDYMSLNLMSFPVEVKNVPDKNGALLTVKGVANVKINSADEHLHRAVERFLGKTEEHISLVAKENLEGNLRGIVGNSEVEGLIADRQNFQSRVLSEAGSDLAKLGLDVDLLNIQDIRDEKGYIESLGRKRTARVISDAKIGEAEATRDADIKSAQAQQEGSIAQANAKQEISNAQRAYDMVDAQNSAQVAGARARVEIVSQIAAAEERKNLNIAEVAADQARVEAETNLQDAVRRKNEAELTATTIVTAEKTAQAKVIEAQGRQEAATRLGEASRIQAEKEGQGEQAKMTAQALGRIQQSVAVQAEKEAEAAGRKALLLAEAQGNEAGLLATAAGAKAALLAEAEGRKALLLAEALGTEEKAKAFKLLDQSGRFLMILEALPSIINAAGDAASKVIVPSAEAIGKGLGNIKELRIVDMGGSSNGSSGNVLTQFMNQPPAALFKLVEGLKATEMMPVISGLLAKMGISLEDLMKAGQPAMTTEVSPPAAS